MKVSTFAPLPKKATLASGDYLHDSKEEWFILFDRIAHLQHIVIPRRRNNPDVVVKHELLYFSLKAKIESLPWPRRTIGAGASSANPSNGNVTPTTQTPLNREDTGKNGGLGDDQVLPITVPQPDNDPRSSGDKDGKADANGDDMPSDDDSEM